MLSIVTQDGPRARALSRTRKSPQLGSDETSWPRCKMRHYLQLLAREFVPVSTFRLNSREPLDRVGVTLYQIDQECRLCIWFCAPLFPVLQRANIGSKVCGE